MMKKIIIIIFLFGFTFLNCSSDESKGGNSESTINWIRDADNPVLSGSDSITDICDPCVIDDNGTFRLYASCVKTADTKAYVCYSESADGTTWTTPEIVFSPSDSGWDNEKVEIPSVLIDNDAVPEKRYKMWYGGASSANPDLTKIGYAYSADGKLWTRLPSDESLGGKEGLVCGTSDSNVYSDPFVLKKGNVYHLWFNSFSEVIPNVLEILHATSADGITWIVDSANPIRPTQDWEMESHIPDNCDDVVHPTVLYNSGESIFSMWYGSFDKTGLETYSGIGYAFSTDGVNWTKTSSNPVLSPNTTLSGEQIGISTGPSVVYRDGTYHLFYCGANASAKRVINHATSH